MTLTINIDNMNTLEQILTLTNKLNLDVNIDASATQAQVHTHTHTRDYTTMKPASDTTVTLKRLDATHFSIPFTGYATRKALKAHVTGMAWDADYDTGAVYKRATEKHAIGDRKLGAWSVPAKEFLDAIFTDGKETAIVAINASEIQSERDKIAAKASKRNK